MATWPKANGGHSQERYMSSLSVIDGKGKRSVSSNSENFKGKGAFANLGMSPVPDGRALSEFSSIHTGSLSCSHSDYQLLFVESRHSRLRRMSCTVTIGGVSLVFTVCLFVIGMILVAFVFKNQSKKVKIIFEVLQAAGLFGFAGGVTNWLGVKLIFNRIPGVFFSGAVTKQFASAKNLVANFILRSFFSPSQVRKYLEDKKMEHLTPEQLDTQVEKLLNSTLVDKIINDKLEVLMRTPEGLRLRMLGVNKAKLAPLVKPYLSSLKVHIMPVLLSSLELLELLNAEELREQIVDLISTRTNELSAPQVKRLVKDALYSHLNWLVFWGSVFGALIGCLAEVASVYVRGIPTSET